MSNNMRLTTVKTILVLAANPRNTSQLQLDQEVREIDEGLRRASQRHQFKLEAKWAVRLRDFYRAVLDTQPHIVHFCGHGAGEDGIVLEDETGEVVCVEAQILASLFKVLVRKGIQCVVLNACYSQVQAQAISQYVNYVIGMNQAIGDKAAVAFAVAFYDAIGAGNEVEFAYELGCSQLVRFVEQQTPVLLKKGQHDSVSSGWVEEDSEVIAPNPYKGLLAFGEEDAAFFFGRERFVDSLVQVTQSQPLVAVIGSSGSGKSSVVFAGLLPQLRSKGNWLIESFRPQSQAFYGLASALVRLLQPELDATQQLGRAAELSKQIKLGNLSLSQVVASLLERYPHKRLLLVIDQFEEIYTLCSDTQEQQQFVDALLDAVKSAPYSLTIVLTLRADFFSCVLNYTAFSAALQQYKPQLLLTMNREEMQSAIEEPAQKMEVTLEWGLTERILNDISLEPGNLPLLEFALTQLWSKQSQGKLTHQAYEEIGGVAKALANHAESVYEQLSEGDRQRIERIFIQLVRPGEGTQDTRCIATRDAIHTEDWDLVTRLASARLVVTGRDEESKTETVEVVHEALIREWARLRGWMKENREFRTWQERLKGRWREWEAMGRDSSALLQGLSLIEAKQWLEKRALELSVAEKELIEQSIAQQEQHKLEEQQRQLEKARLQRRINIGLSSFAVIVLGLAGVAGVNWRKAAISQINSLVQTSDALLNSDNQGEALKASLKAVEQMQGTPWVDGDTRRQVELTLMNTVHNVAAPNTLGGHEKGVYGVSFSADGKMVASASGDKTVKLWDTSTGKQIKTLSGHTNGVWGVSFSADGKMVASASHDKTVKLWDTSTGKQIKTLSGHTDAVYGVSFSADGKMVASASGDKTVKLWDTSTGKQIKTLSGHTDAVYGVSFSADGKMVASASGDNTVKLWDTSTGKQIKTLSGHTNWVIDVSFSADGKMVASASRDNTVKLWDTSTGKQIKTLSGHTSWVWGVSFSADGKMVASGSADNTVKLWDTSTGKQIKTLSGHTNGVYGVSFSPEGKMVASASFDNTVKLWDTSTGKQITTLSGHTNGVNGVSFSPDGKMVASASGDKTVKLWDTSTGKEITTLSGHTNGVIGVSFSADGKMVASASFDNTVKLWDTSTGKQITTLSGHTNGVIGVSFSADGKMVASASGDNTVKLWDTSTGKQITTLSGHTNGVIGVSFSPDGKMVASGSADKTVKLWDTSTGKEITTLSGHTNGVIGVSFSADGKMVASASGDKTVKLWDTSTGKEITTLSGHTNWVNGVSFSADGKMVASGSSDNTVKLWDTSTGKEIKTLSGHTDSVNGVSFSADGKMVASGSSDNKVRLWKWNFDYLLEQGCIFIGEYFKTNPLDNESDRHMCSITSP
jgi:WD40 repeat protein